MQRTRQSIFVRATSPKNSESIYLFRLPFNQRWRKMSWWLSQGGERATEHQMILYIRFFLPFSFIHRIWRCININIVGPLCHIHTYTHLGLYDWRRADRRNVRWRATNEELLITSFRKNNYFYCKNYFIFPFLLITSTSHRLSSPTYRLQIYIDTHFTHHHYHHHRFFFWFFLACFVSVAFSLSISL